MTEHHTLRYDYDPSPLSGVIGAREALRLFRAVCSERLKNRLAFVALCEKYGVDPNAPDASEQVDLQMSELSRPLNRLTDEVVEAYIRS